MIRWEPLFKSNMMKKPNLMPIKSALLFLAIYFVTQEYRPNIKHSVHFCVVFIVCHNKVVVIRDWLAVRFGRTSAELSDKELPKIRFGWFLTMHQFGLSLSSLFTFIGYFFLNWSWKRQIPIRIENTEERSC